MPQVFLALGSNLGDRKQHLLNAVALLQTELLTEVQCSSIYESPPYQGLDQPAYYNQVISGHTECCPDELLKGCLAIEEQLGRVRTVKWASRTIDIDLLYYADRIIGGPHLVIPHYDVQEREFFLAPLAEIAPTWGDPRNGKSVLQMLHEWQESHPDLSLPITVA